MNTWLLWFLLMASSAGMQAAPRQGATRVQAAELKQSLHELRQAVRQYRVEHNGQWPGPALVTQLTTQTDFDGSVGTHFGPYLRSGHFTSPVNGMQSVLSVAQMLRAPTGATAWIYAPVTGEIRANLLGVDPWGRALFNY